MYTYIHYMHICMYHRANVCSMPPGLTIANYYVTGSLLDNDICETTRAVHLVYAVESR